MIKNVESAMAVRDTWAREIVRLERALTIAKEQEDIAIEKHSFAVMCASRGDSAFEEGGAALRGFREEKKVSLRSLALKLNITPFELSDIELGLTIDSSCKTYASKYKQAVLVLHNEAMQAKEEGK